MNFQSLLRSIDPALFDAIQSYRVTDDKLMPLAYQNIPGGRPLHDDWGIMGKFAALQPWQKIRRIDCAYRVPLPFTITSGAKDQKWMLWDSSYPVAPGTRIENRDVFNGAAVVSLPHALVDCAVDGSGWTTFSGFINGSWTPCFKQFSMVIFGKRFLYYKGLKQDVTVDFDANHNPKSDVMAWFPEISGSWK